MPRISPLKGNDVPAKSKPLLEGVRKALGMTPNLMATLAHSPAALQSYLGFGQALGGASLTGKEREQIALAVAGENSCGYCASAHTALAKKAGVDAAEATCNLNAESNDPRTQAALRFAQAVVSKRGFVSDADVAAVRAAGYSDAQIIEIIATVALNIFTNYFNHVVQTEIDFPEVAVREPVGV